MLSFGSIASRALFKQNKSFAKMAQAFPKRQFSLLQNELEQHDFSDPLNVQEL